MASTISAGTTSGTAIAIAGDTSGALQLQTNGTTTAVTISTAQVVTLAQPLPVASGGTGLTTNAGTVLQVVSATKTDTSSFTSSTFADIGSLTVTITPRNTSSKILVITSVNGAWSGGLAKFAFRLMRDATPIAIGDTAGSRIRTTGAMYASVSSETSFTMSTSYLDSPATASAVTYKCQASNLDAVNTVYVNRGFIDTDNTTFGRTVSSITVFEIAG